MKLNARDLDTKEISLDTARNFLDTNHRSRSTGEVSQKSLGLYKDDELIAVAQFCAPRTAAMGKKYSCELLRLAFKSGVRVRGGASKLIKHYIREYKPSDLFTYQDTSGEATAVYEHAGMTLVSQAKRKQYLVAPGKTIKTGSRKEVLGMPYATRYGPDRILGTKLGEVFREDGSRKGNRDIFIEDLGWHIEETSGDRVYEWVDPELTFYTYKITASDSDKYYYGVSHVKKANATVEDCLADCYFGSGGVNARNKFRSWKIKHKEKLQKNVIATFGRKALAYESERELIGELWQDDPLCLNSRSGGNSQIPINKANSYSMRKCLLHGETAHQGAQCAKCKMSTKVKNESICSIHGMTTFRGSSCDKCSAAKSISIKSCVHHGETTFRGKTCQKCLSEGSYSNKICAIHGVTTHKGESCRKCSSLKGFVKQYCEFHGEVSHRGGKCLVCRGESAQSIKFCSTHGETKFNGKICLACLKTNGYPLKNCPVHGESKHLGSSCAKCAAEKRWAKKRNSG